MTYPIERRAWLLDGGGVGLERSPYMKLKPSFFPQRSQMVSATVVWVAFELRGVFR